MQAGFVKIAAVTVLILGFVSVETGLKLMGSPLSAASIVEAAAADRPDQSQQPGGPGAGGAEQGAATNAARATNNVVIDALDYGYSPRVVRARAGQPVQLTVVTNNTYGCTRAFIIPALNVQEILPETGRTVIDIPSQRQGTLRFTCSMGMYGGRIVFE